MHRFVKQRQMQTRYDFHFLKNDFGSIKSQIIVHIYTVGSGATSVFLAVWSVFIDAS